MDEIVNLEEELKMYEKDKRPDKCVEILEKAKSNITERRTRYNQSERNLTLIADLWTCYLKESPRNVVSPKDVGVMMALMKIARIISGVSWEDSYVDACGYLALAAEEEQYEKDS